MLLALKPMRTRSAAMSCLALSNTCDGAPECECQSPATTIAAQSERPAAPAGAEQRQRDNSRNNILFIDVWSSPCEWRDQLNMLRPQKLVYGGDGPHAVAALDQDACIARETARVTGNIGDARDLRFRQLRDLRLGASARRIQRDGLELPQFRGRERNLEEITPGARHRLQPLRCPGRGEECVE